MPASPRLEPGSIEDAMLALLPSDGSPILNRVLRVMLARQLKRSIDEDVFFTARDILLKQGRIGRLRGQGGQLFLDKPAPILEPAAKERLSTDGWSEARLMEPLKLYLEGPFQKGLDLSDGGACIVRDTSAMGPQSGMWARPDFILVSAMRFKLLPGAQVDLHSFELKTETGGSVLAIHEALAQTRFTHFGHFVWHLPIGSRAENKLNDIITHCEEHGIGLIRLKHPDRPTEDDAVEILVDPRRKPTLDSIVDGFLETRLLPKHKQDLMRVVRGSP